MHFHTLTVTMTAFLAAVSHAAPKEAAAAEVMISNMPAGISGAIVGPENTFLAESADDCGANSCHGAGGGDLCNDRVSILIA